MRQVLASRGKIVVEEVPLPLPGPGEVLVRNHYSYVSAGTEMAGLAASGRSLLRRALDKPKNIVRVLEMARRSSVQHAADLVFSQMNQLNPIGYSCAGVIVEVGELVSDLRVGDRVACAGAGKANHADFVTVPRRLCVRVPEGLDLSIGASATIGAIAMQGVRRANIALGETVFVIGLGLVGQLTARIAAAGGARVLGTDLDASRVAMLRSAGIQAVHPGEHDPVETALAFSDGCGVDAVIVAAATVSSEPINQGMAAARKRGRICLLGSTGLEFDRAPFYEKELDVVMSTSYGPGRYDPEYEDEGIDYPRPFVRWTAERNLSEYLRLCQSGRISFDGIVPRTFSVDNASAAFESLTSGERPVAVLLSYDGEAGTQRLQRIATHARVESGPIRIAIVGMGSFARSTHLPNIRANPDQFRLVAISSRRPQAALALGRAAGVEFIATDPEKIFASHDIDAVMISTRHDSHARLAAAGLRSGKAVFLEKPLALSEGDLRDVESAARETGLPLLVCFNRRFSPAAVKAREILNGLPGPSVALYRVNAGPLPPGHWTRGPEGGGRAIGEACHMVDLLGYLVGSSPELVSVEGLGGDGSAMADENFSAQFRWSDGSHATLLYSSLGNPGLPKERCEVFRGGVSLVINDFSHLEVYGTSQRGWQGRRQDKGHLATLLAFAGQVRSGSPAISLEELTTTTRLTFAIASGCGRSAS